MRFLIICLLFTFFIPGNVCSQSNRIEVNGQQLFISGMNLAWVNFARDLTQFNEETFTKA